MASHDHVTAKSMHEKQIRITAKKNGVVTRARDVRPEGAQPLPFAVFQRPKEVWMRSQHAIIGVASLLLVGCARLVPPDSIIALEVGPQQVNVMVGARAPLRVVGTRGDGRTVKVSAREVRFASSDTSVAQVTRDGAIKGVRMGRASISATMSTPSGPVTVDGITVAVGRLVAKQ